VLYFARKGFNARAIYHELRATFGPETVSYPSVTMYLREAKFSFSIPSSHFFRSDLQAADLDTTILLTLD
jgi:hypothetical protein